MHTRALERSSCDALRAAVVLDAVLGRSGSHHARQEMLVRTTARMPDGADPALLGEVVRRRGAARLRAGAVKDARADAEWALALARGVGDLAREAGRARVARQNRMVCGR